MALYSLLLIDRMASVTHQWSRRRHRPPSPPRGECSALTPVTHRDEAVDGGPCIHLNNRPLLSLLLAKLASSTSLQKPPATYMRVNDFGPHMDSIFMGAGRKYQSTAKSDAILEIVWRKSPYRCGGSPYDAKTPNRMTSMTMLPAFTSRNWTTTKASTTKIIIWQTIQENHLSLYHCCLFILQCCCSARDSTAQTFSYARHICSKCLTLNDL